MYTCAGTRASQTWIELEISSSGASTPKNMSPSAVSTIAWNVGMRQCRHACTRTRTGMHIMHMRLAAGSVAAGSVATGSAMEAAATVMAGLVWRPAR